ncbi:MAG: phenylacetate--CoA ligase family protein [Christensenellales bacterium]
MYWNQHAECMEREQLEKLQLQKLRQTAFRAYQNVPYYRDLFQKANILPDDIKSLDDLEKLPFLAKEDLRINYPYGLFAVPLSEIVRLHASSGTTGKPTVAGYTNKDLNDWTELMARALTSGGVEKNSIVQVAFGYGLFTGGLGAHYGAERIGASVIPISTGNTGRQIMLMKDFGTTTLLSTPSYALYLAEAMEEMGVRKEDLKLKFGVFGAEPWTEGMRTEIQNRLGIRATDIYGLSEITGPGVSCECEYQCGMHIAEDYFYPEIIDPIAGKTLPHGETGELVITTLDKEGMPLIRYRTHDITSLNYERCQCGRTLVRMGKVAGRSDDMLIIRGVNVFPSQIEEILMANGDVDPNYMIIVDRVDNLDSLEVMVEVSNAMFFDEVKMMEKIRNDISRAIQSVLGLSAKISLVEPKTLARSEGKAKRVTDKRKL